MGKRGRKPKSRELNKLDGNPSKRPMLPDDVAISVDMPPVKPAVVAMDETASKEWDRLISVMPPELYTAADVAVLTTYCLSWSMLHKVECELDQRGLIIEEHRFSAEGELIGSTLKKNPALPAWNLALSNLLKATDRLGLYPGARARLEIPKRGDRHQSKWAGKLHGSTD